MHHDIKVTELLLLSLIQSIFLIHDCFMYSKSYHLVTFKYVLSTMGVSKESISKFLIGNSTVHHYLRVEPSANVSLTLSYCQSFWFDILT